MSGADERRGALDAVERLVNRGAEADETLRGAVAALHERVREYAWVGVSLREGEALVRGPERGPRSAAPDLRVPILYEGRTIGELAVAAVDGAVLGDEDGAFLERVATLISAYALVAWDTGGAAWEP